MKKVRTHLEDRVLPSYTKGEEIFNMVSHIAGGALAIAALVLCVIFAVIHTDMAPRWLCFMRCQVFIMV